MTPEGKVKKEIKDYLKSLGPDCWHFSPVLMGYGRNGIPDILGCYKGKFFAIEVKAPGRMTALTPWQQKEIDGINTARGVAVAVSSLEKFKEWFGAWIDL